MTGCIVLKDSEVHEILINLNKNETVDFLKAIKNCLRDFSLSEERTYQPAASVINRPTGQKTLFRPFTSATSVGTKIIVHPAPDSNGRQKPLHGVLVLCDNRGIPTGILNAEEVTGYRTSLSAITPFMWRQNASRIVVFGAGKQALWHIRLALSLRGSEVDSITIINRSDARGQLLIKRIEEENQNRWKSKAKLTHVSPASTDYDTKLAGLLAEADVIFCTVPSESPLFPAQLIVDNTKQSQKRPLITAIGSWQPDMIEVDPGLLRYVVNDPEAYNPKSDTGGVIIVDDRPGSLEHAGEVVQSKLEAKRLIELGEILGAQQGQDVWSKQPEKDEMKEWMAEGLVIYKSIGVSVTDLAAAELIISLALERRVGTAVSQL